VEDGVGAPRDRLRRPRKGEIGREDLKARVPFRGPRRGDVRQDEALDAAVGEQGSGQPPAEEAAPARYGDVHLFLA
jgi:hypothetical protein